MIVYDVIRNIIQTPQTFKKKKDISQSESKCF